MENKISVAALNRSFTVCVSIDVYSAAKKKLQALLMVSKLHINLNSPLLTMDKLYKLYKYYSLINKNGFQSISIRIHTNDVWEGSVKRM